MQIAGFDKLHDRTRRQARKQPGIVERGEFLCASALFAKKLETHTRLARTRLRRFRQRKKTRETIEYLRVLAAQKYVSPYGMAEIFTALDEKEQAFAELEKAADEHSWWLIFAGVNPRFDKLKPARRFLSILKKINLDKFVGGGSK